MLILSKKIALNLKILEVLIRVYIYVYVIVRDTHCCINRTKQEYNIKMITK